MTLEPVSPSRQRAAETPPDDDNARQQDNAPAYLTRDGGKRDGLLISVVIPTYNGKRFLKEAIDSVLSQDYPYVECIVIDAGSTDGSIDLIKSYGDKIQWRSRKDRGAFDAINEGWKMSRGEVLAWVNADDRWEPGAARIAARYFANHPDVDVLYGGLGGIAPDGTEVADFPPREWDLEYAIEYCDHIIHQTASFMRRDIIERIGFLYPAWCHDHDLWLRIGIAGGKFGVTTRRLASARMWDANLGNNPAIIIDGKVGLTRRLFDNPDLPDALKPMKGRAISNAYLRCLYYVAPTKPKNWKLGLSLMSRAIKEHPRNIFYLLGRIAYFFGKRIWDSIIMRIFWGSRKIVRLTRAGLRRVFGVTSDMTKLRSRLKYFAPLGAVAGGAVAAIAAGEPAVATAGIFFFVATPLLITVFLYDARWRQ